MSDWTWDPTLFAGAAAHYERGRLPYAPGLADALVAALRLDRSSRLLDVGCGPGTVALRVAPLVDEVVGVDADPDMLAEAARLAGERGVGNATWVHARAEELPGGLGRFSAVTFAASLHWMDRPLVFRAVRALLAPGGAVVHVDNRQQGLVARPAVEAVRRRHLGPDRRAGQGIRNTSPGDEDDVFRAAGFTGPEVVVVPDGRRVERSADDVLHEILSLSGTAPHLFGDRLDDFVADVRAVLPPVEVVVLPDNHLRIWRPA